MCGHCQAPGLSCHFVEEMESDRVEGLSFALRLTSLSGRTPAFGSPLSRPAVLITSRFVCDSCSFHHDSSVKLVLAYQSDIQDRRNSDNTNTDSQTFHYDTPLIIIIAAASMTTSQNSSDILYFYNLHILQYKKPNSQSGIFPPTPTSTSSFTT